MKTNTLLPTIFTFTIFILLAIGCDFAPNSRSPFANAGPTISAAPGTADNTQGLIGSKNVIRNLFELEALGLNKGAPHAAPWSDSYWPTYLGGIAVRYADPNFPSTKDFTTNLNYYRSNPMANYFPDRIQQLSPAEKYDLLIGAGENGLAKKQLLVGQEMLATYDEVPLWAGYCDGWSAAAHWGIAAPAGPVTLTSADGVKLEFYQSDIKALVSLLWSQASPPYVESGSRCNFDDPVLDENGRPLQTPCFDVNPMAWHLVVTHRVGREGKGVVYDSHWGAPVWNYPIKDYAITYFNPITEESADRAINAVVRLSDWTADKYYSYRNPQAEWVVGIQMDIGYPKFTIPHTNIHGVLTGSFQYRYDLELDSEFNIVGGEWHSTDRPDYVWSFADGANVHVVGEDQLTEPSIWNPGEPFPHSWAALAGEQARKGVPLPKIVNAILEATRSGSENRSR